MPKRQSRWYYAASAVVLVLGLSAAVLIYIAAANAPSDDEAYQVAGGFAAPGGGAHTKRYVHDLELYGGKAAVLADDIDRFWSGLWQGEQLAYTVAVIAGCVSGALFLVARSRSHSPSFLRPEDNGGASGKDRER